MIKAILFDKDGTLIDFHKTWGRWAAGFLNHVADGDEALVEKLAAAIQFDPATFQFDPSSPVIAGTPEEGVNLIAPHLPQWRYDDLLACSNDMARDAPLAEVLPLRPFLAACRSEGLGLGVATNDSEATARVHMTTLGVEDMFDAIIGSDSGHGGKPGPGMCLAFAQKLGLDPGEVLMVGDSTHDFEAGRAAGMACVGVLTGVASRDDLEPHADAVFGDIGAIPDWLRARAS